MLSIRRQTACVYTEVANMLQSLDSEDWRENQCAPSSSKATSQDPFGMPFLQGAAFDEFNASPVFHRAAWDQVYMPRAVQRGTSAKSSPVDSTCVTSEDEHPFHNYWTKEGGLAEVMNVLLEREQALSLVANFFESVDPLYPMLSQYHLIAEMEHLWGLSPEEKCSYDAAKLALHFVVFAAGAYFAPDMDADQRGRMADLYLSASHQSLCLCSYVRKFSLGTTQVILLIGYLLISA